MNRVLKYAWYQLIVIVIATLLAGVSVWVAATYWRGKEVSAIIIFGWFILLHLFKVFFPLKPGEIPFDERDEAIKNRATRISFVILWYLFALWCLLPVMILGNNYIHVMYLGSGFLMAAILLRLIWSIAVIVQYGRSHHDCIPEGGAI